MERQPGATFEPPRYRTIFRQFDAVAAHYRDVARFSEPCIAAYAEAVLRLRQGEAFTTFMVQPLDVRFGQHGRGNEPFNGEDYFDLLLKAVDLNAAQLGRRIPSADFEEADGYLSVIDEIMADNVRAAFMQAELATRTAQTPVAQRYAVVPIIANSQIERFGPSPRVLDLGSSTMDGPLKIARGEPFKPMTFIPRRGPQTRRLSNRHASEQAAATNPSPLSQQLNRLLEEPLAAPDITCVDRVDPFVRENWEFSYFSLRPSELDPSRPTDDRYRDFVEAATNQDNLRFFLGEVVIDNGEVVVRDDRPGEQAPLEPHSFDMILFTVMLRWANRDIQQRFCELGSRLLSKDGILVVSDWVNLNGPRPIFLTTKSQPYTYRSYTYGLDRSLAGPASELFSYRDGRAEIAAIGRDIDALTHTRAA